MLSTTEITSRSFQLYKQNWKPMLIAGFISLVLTQITDVSTDGVIGSTLLALALSVLIAPLTQGGYYFFQMNVWSEKPSSVKDILYFCQSAGLYTKALCFFFCYLVCITVAMFAITILPTMLLAFSVGTHVHIPFHVGITILLVGIALWIFIRISLSPYLYIFQSEESAIVIIAKSYEMMKGYVGKFILIFLMSILIELVYFIPEFIMEEAGIQSGAASVILFVLHLLVYPLTSMMMAGFACEVLREHGVIADESAELVEEDNESYVLHDDEVQDAVITETKEDNVYYD